MSDTSGVIPDDQDTVDTASDGGMQNSGIDAVQHVLNYGRQKYGLTKQQGPGMQFQGKSMMHQDDAMPFQGKSMPFQGDDGEQARDFAEGGAVEDDSDGFDNQYPEAGFVRRAIRDYNPEKPDVASQVGQQKLNDMGDEVAGRVGAAVKGVIPDDAEPNQPDRATQIGSQKLNEMGDSMAADVGAALKGAGGAIADTFSSLNQEPTTPNPVAGAGQYIKDKLGAIPDAISSYGTAAKNLYLRYMTADAAPQQEVARAEAAANPTGEKPDGETRVAAIQAATQMGGPEAGWRILQAYRQKYELLRQSAAAVAGHGDTEHAAALATKAYDMLPDGTDVHFISTSDGVTATVTQGDRVLAQVPMSTQQFQQWVAAPTQQFDNALNTTPAVSLQQQAKAFSPAAAANGGMGEFNGQVSFQPRADGQPSLRGQAPQAQPDRHLAAQRQAAGTEVGGIKTMADAERVAQRLFPLASQQQLRAQWVAKIMGEGGQKYPSEERQATSKNEASLERAKISGGSRENVATINAGSREKIQEDKGRNYNARTIANLQTAAAKMAQQASNAHERNVFQTLQSISRNAMFDPKQVEDFAKEHKIDLDAMLGGAAAPQAPTPQAPTPQASTPVQVKTPADYEALRPGQAYVDPKGVRKIKGQ